MSIEPELAARMEALVRVIAACPPNIGLGNYQCAIEARAIVALLPEPIDPDLIEARAIAAGINPYFGQSYLDGLEDKSKTMIAAFTAIKRGRELAAKDMTK